MELKDRLDGSKSPIKVYWWRLDDGKNGNFGDEITREIIKYVYNRDVEWSPPELCEIIGAGSTIEQVSNKKCKNKPFLWSTGFIQSGDSTISVSDYKIICLRGKESLKRIKGDASDILLGDIGLLASYLLGKMPNKQYKLGIMPHYIDKNHKFMADFLKKNDSVHIIDATWPCKKVIKEIARCETILSSSLHGLIAADSLGVPNIHLKLSDNVIGGDYKFNDYYSVYSNRCHNVLTPESLDGKNQVDIAKLVRKLYVSHPDIKSIKERLVASFPFSEITTTPQEVKGMTAGSRAEC